jgi:nitroimidazol reductase NimA-like FMN-containing flavoprotein (pyridoxamine 5'-phosphate oxidase superfamily)
MRKATDADTQACRDFLLENEYAVIASSNKNVPSAAVVMYIMDENWNIYFFTRKSTTKHKNLLENKHIALVVGTGPESITTQVTGTARELSEAEADEWMDEFLIKREGYYATFLKLQGSDFVGYVVKPSEIRWLHIAPNEENEDIARIMV